MSGRHLGFAAGGLGLLALLVYLLTGPPSLGRDALGYEGVSALLETRGISLELSNRPPSEEEREGLLRLLIEPLVTVNGRRDAPGILGQETLDRKLAHTPTILIFPKWVLTEGGRRIDRHNRLDLVRLASALDAELGENFVQEGMLGDETVLHAANGPALLYAQGVLANASADFTALIEHQGVVLVGRLDRPKAPPVLLIFDPDLVSNHGLALANHAELIIPVLEAFIADNRVLVDRTLWEPRTSRAERAQGGPVRDRDTKRLFSFPFAYVWIALLLLMALGLWAFLGRGEGISAGPEGLQPPPSLQRRLDRLARLWARHVPAHEIMALYERALITQTSHRLGLSGDQDQRWAALIEIEQNRHGESQLAGMGHETTDPRKTRGRLERLQTLRRILHDL